MADIVITAANVLKGAGAEVRSGIFGATITQGQALYKDAADNKLKLADTDSGTAAAREVEGISLSAGSNGQPGFYLKSGLITIGGTVTVGKIYVLSGNAGGIAPIDDLASGDYTAVIGIGVSATQIKVGILNGGVAIPA